MTTRTVAAAMRHVVVQIAKIARTALYEGDDRESN